MLPSKSNLCSLQPRRFSAYQGSKVPQLTTLLNVHDVFSIRFVVPVIQLYLFGLLCLLLFIPLWVTCFFPHDLLWHLQLRGELRVFGIHQHFPFGRCTRLKEVHRAARSHLRKHKKNDVSTNRLSIYQNRYIYIKHK